MALPNLLYVLALRYEVVQLRSLFSAFGARGKSQRFDDSLYIPANVLYILL